MLMKCRAEDARSTGKYPAATGGWPDPEAEHAASPPPDDGFAESTHIQFIADRGGDVLSTDLRWSAWAGMTDPSDPGRAFRAALSPRDRRNAWRGWLASVRSGREYAQEHRVILPGGNRRWVRVRAALRPGGDGQAARWFGFIEDVEELHHARAAAIDAEDRYRGGLAIGGSRAAEKARYPRDAMSAGPSGTSAASAASAATGTDAIALLLAHDLNQPLTSIANYVRGARRLLVRGDADARERAIEALEAAARSAADAGAIVRHLARPGVGKPTPARAHDLHDLIHDACAAAGPGADLSGIAIRIDIDPAARRVMVDRMQIRQVFANLIGNAVEAMADSADRVIDIRGSVRYGCAQVRVADSGPGIAVDIAAKLFSPVTSTKRDGLGIGLSLCRAIVEANGGRIRADPDGGPGAVFHLALPLAGAE